MDVAFTVSPPTSTIAAPQPAALDVRYGYLFLPGADTPVSLDGGSPRSRVACALIAAFRAAPGRPLSIDALATAAWPTRPIDDAGRTRLRVTIHRLRAAGLPIRTIGQGYAIDHRVTREGQPDLR